MSATDQTIWKLAEALKSKLSCEVSFSNEAKALYATDASNYRQVPIAVVKPETEEDIKTTIRICHSLNVPILMRGGGTSLAGQTCNVAVVLDLSAHYNHILEMSPEGKYARVQPGIVLDEVRQVANKYGLTFGPDPATHSRCTLGGMIGNNSCGAHAQMAGKTVENIVALRILTYDGQEMTVGPTSDREFAQIVQAGGRRAEIYSGLRAIRDKYKDLIRKNYPQIPRRVSGYNLDQLLPENDFNVARALVGTEGTCAVVLEATLRLVANPPKRALVVLGFIDIEHAGHAVPAVLKHQPIALEGLDDILVHNVKLKHIHAESTQKLPEGMSWLLVEFGSDSDAENTVKAESLRADAPAMKGFRDLRIMTDESEQKQLWEVREAGLGATAYVPGESDTWEGWEDSAVPPDKVGFYLRDLKKLYDKFAYRGALYGHFGQGCIHTRINFELRTADGIKKFHQFISEASDLVVSYGGSLSGEHGDGQSKAEFLPKMFGPEIVEAFNQFKDLWDPGNKMNPHKVARPYANTENLRLGTGYAPVEPETYFKYPQDKGSFTRATIRCVGIGQCRRHGEGVMCPSYMVTRDEKHSTRGRARLLFEMLRRETIAKGWNSPEVKEALDLCLACKGCKGECPTNVDMATYKAEFLAHHYQKNRRPRDAYSMGQIYLLTLVAKWFPGVLNFLTSAPVISSIVKKIGGIHRLRKIPKFARINFRKAFFRTKRDADANRPKVLLWADTFNNSFSPEVLLAASRVLHKAGFTVIVTKKAYCCGRPLYDYGFLPQAKRYLLNIIDGLRTEIRSGLPFVFLEPSCVSVFRDELPSLLPHDQDAFRLSQQCFMLSEFLLQRAPGFAWPALQGDALVQGHCHHKSVLKYKDEEAALKNTGLKLELLDSGCCGMAGAFGYTEDHYSISKAIGERVLLKKVRESDPQTLVIADGFSCRQQIVQETGRKVVHLAQLLDPALELALDPA